MQKQSYSEIPIITASGAHKAFLPGSFYELTPTLSHVREHNYTEIHLLADGDASFNVEGEHISVKGGEMLVIPRKTYHSCESKDDAALHCAFQVDCEIAELSKFELGGELIALFFDAVERSKQSGDHSAIAAHMALFCSYFDKGNRLYSQTVTDSALLICEFFSKNYDSDVRLSDLAEMLHLSERQTERLVIEHTGRNFRDELAATRVRIARYLLKTTDMSMQEVARRAGYSTYSGFWKAMKKF